MQQENGICDEYNICMKSSFWHFQKENDSNAFRAISKKDSDQFIRHTKLLNSQNELECKTF